MATAPGAAVRHAGARLSAPPLRVGASSRIHAGAAISSRIPAGAAISSRIPAGAASSSRASTGEGSSSRAAAGEGSSSRASTGAASSSRAPRIAELADDYDEMLDREPKTLKEALRLLHLVRTAVVQTNDDNVYWEDLFKAEKRKRVMIEAAQVLSAVSGAASALSPLVARTAVSGAVSALSPLVARVLIPAVQQRPPPPPITFQQPPPPPFVLIAPPPPPPPPVVEDSSDCGAGVAAAVLMASAVVASADDDADMSKRKRTKRKIFAPCKTPAARDWKPDDKKDHDEGKSADVLFPPSLKTPEGNRGPGRPPGSKNRL